MTADMNNTEPNDAHHRPAGAGPVQHTVRPAADARWYCVSRQGMATLCTCEDDAKSEATKGQENYPRSGPYRAMQLVDAAEIQRLRAELAEYFKAADASWRETCARAAKQGIASMEIGPANAAALEKFQSLRALYGPNV